MFSEDETFQSKLNQESLKVAVEELNENEKDRKSAVQSFRHLIQQHKWLRTPTGIILYIWATTRQNLSSGFQKKRDSNQSTQLQRLARKLKMHLWQV